jgi:hypothetical protein
MLWKTLFGAAGLYGVGGAQSLVIHSPLPRVKSPQITGVRAKSLTLKGLFGVIVGFPNACLEGIEGG